MPEPSTPASEATRTRLAAQERELQQTAEKLRSIIDTVVDGIITIDAHGCIQSANPAALRLFAYSQADMLGNNVKMLMPEPYHSAHDGYLANHISTGVKKIIGIGREVVGRRSDGSTFPMELAVGAMVVNGERMFTGVVRDISERNEQARWHAQYSAIIASSNDAIISKTLEGIVTSWNPAATKMFGYTQAEMLGQTMVLLVPADHVDEEPEILSKIRRGEFIEHFETVRRRKNGEVIPVSVTISPIRDRNGTVIGASKIARDISERKKAERMKSEFVATVSHELRTPLTSIRGALGLVLGKFGAGMADKARQLLETANRNSERLTLLINDILDLEKIESGRLDFEFKPADLVTIANQALSANEGYGQQHGVKLVLREAPPSASVWADAHRLLQVFANLISNAVKYSPPGGTVELSLQAVSAGWRVGVRDHGSGIPEEFKQRMFQRFAQADSSDTRQKGGTGLGLSITKAIVERHSGSIGYTSQADQGTEFFFVLPHWQEVLAPDPTGDARPRMLICEDNPDVAMVLAELLAQEGIASDRAATGAAALELLARQTYRGLLLDLGLPDMDGISLVQTLRSKAATRDLPVVVVSGRAAENRSWEGDSLSVLDWLQKPVDQARLSAVLSQVLRQRHNEPVSQSRRILHVEDDPDIIQVTQALIADLAEYHYAVSLADARAQLRQSHFDLVLLDLTLPDGSGAELLNELTANTQVVIFSGLETGQSLNQQVAAALTKGTTSNAKLVATLRQIIQQQGD